MSSFGFPWGPAGLQTFWPQRVPCLLARRPVATLGLEDHVFTTCVHGSKHAWQRLKWLADLAAFYARYPGLDWEGLLARVAAYDVRRAFLLGWFLLEQALRIPVPPAIGRALATEPALPALAQACLRLWLRPDAFVEGEWTTLRFRFGLLEGWRARGRFAYNYVLIPSEADWALLPFVPRSMPLLVSLVRPFHLVVRQGSRLLRAAAKRSARRANSPAP